MGDAVAPGERVLIPVVNTFHRVGYGAVHLPRLLRAIAGHQQSTHEMEVRLVTGRNSKLTS